MKTLPKTTFTLRPIAAADAARHREQGGPVYVADSFPGYPCRQCLRDAEVDEELILVSHDPFLGDSPYRGASPIFLHKVPCGPPAADELPAQLTRRTLQVRAFDENELMVDAELVDGVDLEAAIERLFADESTVRLRVHNTPRGCWATDVERLSAPTP